MNAPEEREAVKTIAAASPHIVWVGLGTPKQDLWMQRLLPDLGGVLSAGGGAAVDFISGNRPRRLAPVRPPPARPALLGMEGRPRGVGAAEGVRPAQARPQVRGGQHALH